MDLAALLLADGRFPAGGHAHSAGLEGAVADGRVHDHETLRAYVTGRLHGPARADAALAAASGLRLATDPSEAQVFLLDREAGARMVVPALRAASRRLGRQMVRAGSRCWPAPVLALVDRTVPAGVHLPVALGAVGVAAGLEPLDVARLAVHHALTTPAQAAVRLLGLDPFEVAALVASLGPAAEHVARAATLDADGPLDELPAVSGPVCDIAAHVQGSAGDRLFIT